MHQSNTFLFANLVSQLNQFMVVGLMHVGKTWACGKVLATQRMFREEVDVVSDNHQITDFEVGVHTT